VKVLFYGTPEFAVATLRRLLESSHQVVGVVTQPDKPTGRGRKLTAPPVKVVAEQAGIPVFQPTTLRKGPIAEQLAALAPDVAVVVAYGKILPANLLTLPRHGCLNIHASLLPAYRGAAPIQWAIIRGERKTGVSIMQMDEGMDTGPVIATREVPILDDDDAVSLAGMLAFDGADLMIEVLDQLERDGRLESTPQDESKATYAPPIERAMARIDWEKDPDTIICAVRGFMPWPKAFTYLGDMELKITGIEGCDSKWVPESTFTELVRPGMVVAVLKGRGFVVRTGGNRGVVLVTRVQPPGRPDMSAQDFVNGGGIDVGAVLI
jgi:methionyl-tRNA formyltransferase